MNKRLFPLLLLIILSSVHGYLWAKPADKTTKLIWTTADGKFDTSNNTIRALDAKSHNYIWLNAIYDDFEMDFQASKSPKSDFRVYIGSNSTLAHTSRGTFHQIIIPYSRGESRVGHMNNGRWTRIKVDIKNIEPLSYRVKVKLQEKHLMVWIDGQVHIDIMLEMYQSGYIGFGWGKGIKIEDFMIH